MCAFCIPCVLPDRVGKKKGGSKQRLFANAAAVVVYNGRGGGGARLAVDLSYYIMTFFYIYIFCLLLGVRWIAVLKLLLYVDIINILGSIAGLTGWISCVGKEEVLKRFPW